MSGWTCWQVTSQWTQSDLGEMIFPSKTSWWRSFVPEENVIFHDSINMGTSQSFSKDVIPAPNGSSLSHHSSFFSQTCQRRQSIGSWLCRSSLQSSVRVPKSSKDLASLLQALPATTLLSSHLEATIQSEASLPVVDCTTHTHMPGSVSPCVACQSFSTSSVQCQGQVCSVLLDSLSKHVASERDGARKAEQNAKWKNNNNNKNPLCSSYRKPLIIISKTARGFVFMCAHNRKQMTEAQIAAVGLRGGREPLEWRNKTKYQCEEAGEMFREFSCMFLAQLFSSPWKTNVAFVSSPSSPHIFKDANSCRPSKVPGEAKSTWLTSYQWTQLSESVLLLRKSHDVTRGTDISRWCFLS